ncbi:MAG: hypothetical protein PHC62_01000 [Candidatus Izemoplasmatales bacterium]|nr:hypothetical protein [Candidatus Izemoplasmatales bacterium]
MAITPNDLQILNNKEIFETSSDKFILSEDYEMIFRDPEFRVLGFIGNNMYTYTEGYVSKYTTDGKFISKIMIEVEHGAFHENAPFMYLFYEYTVYKVTKNLVIEWSITLEDYIRHINMDSAGDFFVLFQNSRSVHKYNREGKLLLYFNQNEDASKTTRLYRTFVTKGRGFLYTIGTRFYDNKCDVFIDQYNLYKGILVERQYLTQANNVLVDSEDYEFHDIYIDGDYIYLRGHNTIQKVNLRLQPIWKMIFGWNSISNQYNKLTPIEYDDSNYQDYIYFCEDLSDTNGYSYGKLTTNGNLLWKFTAPENDMDVRFNLAIRDEYLYIYNRESLQAYIPSILALNNNSLLFETRDHRLVKLVEYNKEYLNSEYFGGKRLIADEFKADIPERIYVPLLYQDGYITNDEDKVLVFKDDNKDYYKDENFLYKQLIAEILDTANYIKSRIRLSSGLYLVTGNGNRIATKEPYKIELSYDIIKSKSGELIRTKNSQEILRKDGKPFVYYNLLSDYFKFYTALATKRLRNILITKDKGDYLSRKTNQVYRYYMRKLKDINLLVEYMIQNSILDTVFPNYVEKLKHHTTSILDDVQEATCPCYYDLKAVKVMEYQYDAMTFPIDQNYMSIFLCKNLPFTKKKEFKPLDIRSIADMIEDETIHPFMLFINGRAIKWSDITVVRDWHDSYLIIENMNDHTVYSEEVDCILFPCSIHYGEDNIIDENNDSGMYFTDDGIFTTNNEDIGIRIEVIDEDILCTSQTMDETKNYIEIDTQASKLSSEYNIFIFDRGIFDTDNRYYLHNTGYNMYGYTRSTENVLFKTYYYIKDLESKNMIFNIPNQENVKEDIVSALEGIENHQYLSTLNYSFDFSFSKNKSYDRNIAEALDYIASYDIDLLMKYYKKKSNILTTVLSGEEVNEKAQNGNLMIPVLKKPRLEDHIIVYKNGELYEEQSNIETRHKVFAIPLNGFLDDDVMEITHFKNVHNDVYDIKVIDSDSTVIIPEVLRNDNFLLYDSNHSLVDFIYSNQYNDYGTYMGTKIRLTNDILYGTSLTLVSKRQFHYHHTETIGVDNSILLNDDFIYTHNEEQYIVFVNGLKIRNDQWNLIISNEPTLYLTDISDMIHRVDVFYLPELYEEISMEEYQTKFSMGDVTIESDLPFDKDVFFIYVDGKKIPINEIQEIDRDSFRIYHLEGDTIPNLSICKFIQSDHIIRELMSYDELWSDGVDTLDKVLYERLFKRLQS